MADQTELEKQIIQQARASIAEAIKESLTGYNSPLKSMIENVVSEHVSELKKIFGDAFTETIRDDAFKAIILEEFKHKVAKMLVSKLSGSVEKAVNALRSNPVLNSQMILAIETIVKEAE
jgi:hypothetical protein